MLVTDYFLKDGFGQKMTEYALKPSNDLFIQCFLIKKTDFVIQKTDFDHRLRPAGTKVPKTFDVVEL